MLARAITVIKKAVSESWLYTRILRRCRARKCSPKLIADSTIKTELTSSTEFCS